jgi:tetratricopeptide (TPR) repeat protein
VAAAVAWFALAVLPVSNLLFAVGVLLAERNLYLPSVAVAFLVPPLVHAAARGRRELRLAAAGAAAVLLALGAAKTWTRTPVWHSTGSVLRSMMESHPELWWVDWTAGKILVQRGRTDEGLQWYRRAMAKVDHNHAIMNLEYVHVLRRAGRLGETEALLRHSVRTFEGSVPPYTLLAALLIDQGRYAEVPALMDRAEAIPRSGALSLAELNDRRALAWDGLGKLDQALAARRENLRDPFFRRGFVPWYHYARLLALAGDTAGARMAVDSARARTSPRLRPLLTLDPVPSLRSPLVRSWAPIPELPPPPPPAR